MKVGSKVLIRPVEFSDAPLLMNWENDPEIMKVSDRTDTYTFEEITQLIDSSIEFRRTEQQRWMIETMGDYRAIGTVDVFNHSLNERRLSIGILIQEQSDRGKGYAFEAISLVHEVLKSWGMERVDSLVEKDNIASLKLFKSLGYNYLSDSDESDNITLEFCLKK